MFHGDTFLGVGDVPLVLPPLPGLADFIGKVPCCPMYASGTCGTWGLHWVCPLSSHVWHWYLGTSLGMLPAEMGCSQYVGGTLGFPIQGHILIKTENKYRKHIFFSLKHGDSSTTLTFHFLVYITLPNPELFLT